MFSSSSSSFFLLFAADPKVPETVCLSGLIPTGAILTTGNYWFPISAFKKKMKKNPFLSCSSSCGPSLSLAQEEELVTGDLPRCRRVNTHGSAHRPLVIRISKIHFSPGAPLTR